MANTDKKDEIIALIPELLKVFQKDYAEWDKRAKARYPNSGKSRKRYGYEKGSTYIRLITFDEPEKEGEPTRSRSVVGFVQVKDGKFPAGTILKAAGWKAPATNFARGNIFDKSTWNYKWTGVS
jgi:hypothetical protein